jgi:hypothetical protein
VAENLIARDRHAVAVLTPGAGSSTGTRVLVHLRRLAAT